jgi:DNA-binding transcriptional LysR family regulator
MEMQQVRYFLAVAQTLNFTRAAEQCNVSQPALTRAIKLLEEELGGELIRREGRLSHLTDLGKSMSPLLEQCYGSALAAKTLAKSLKTGEIAILDMGVSKTFDIGLLLPLLSEVYRAFPGLQFKVKRGATPQMWRMLETGELEVAIGWLQGDASERIEAWSLFTETFDVVVGTDHDLARRNVPKFDPDLALDERFLVHSGIDASAAEKKRLVAAGVDLALAHEVDSTPDLEAMVAAGLGLGLAPSASARSPRLRHLEIASLGVQRTVVVAVMAGRQRSRPVAGLLNLLRGADWSEASHWPSRRASPPEPR